MEISLGIVVIFTVLLLYYWYRRPARLPPGPRGIPIVGYAPFMGKFIERTAYKLSKKYGPVMSVRMGREDWLILNDYDSISQALVKKSAMFSGRPEPVFAKVTAAKGLAFHDYGDSWKIQRKFGLMTLRGLGVGKKSMEEFCLEELTYLSEAILNECEKPFDISGILHNAISNNICSVTFGRRFDYNDKEFNKVLHSLLHSFDDPFTAKAIKLFTLLPQLADVPPFTLALNSFLHGDFKVIIEWISKVVEEHHNTFDKQNLRDFIDAFIVEMKKENNPTFTKFQLVQYIHDLFIAGTETTSSTLYWSLLCLLHYPEVQSKLRKEIMDVIGPSGKISTASKLEMHYTNAFIQEIFRYRTLAPLSVVHMTSEATELNGYIIPKRTKVLPNLWAVHNDTKFWKEPEKFIPERFLDDAGRFVHSNRVIPFSIGPRHCLGEQLARMEVFLFLIGMVQKFEFLPDPSADNLPDIESSSGGLACVALPYNLVAKQL